MNAFLVGENSQKCLSLFKEKGSFFDIQRAREKRWRDSGCKNRFSLNFGFDIGDLSNDSLLKTQGGACFVHSDFALLSGREGLSVFGGPPITQKDLQNMLDLPVEKSLGKELSNIGVKPASKIRELREFLESVGRGLPTPWIFHEEEQGEDIRTTIGSMTVLLSLEQEGKIWIPETHLYFPTKSGEMSYGGRGALSVNDREMCFPITMKTQMKKIRRLPAKTRHVVVPVLVSRGGHANVLVIDRKKKRVSFFEPHGITSQDRFFQGTKEFLKAFIDTFDMFGYKAEYGESSCPWFGPQALEPRDEYKTGYCQTWTDLFVYCKIKFPELSDAEINYALTHGVTPREVRDRVERFAAFAWEEGRKAAKKSKRYSDMPEKAFFFGKTGGAPSKPIECVKF